MEFKIGDTVTLITRPETRFKITHISGSGVQSTCTLTGFNYIDNQYYDFYIEDVQLVEERSIEQRIILKIGQLERRHALFLMKKYPNKVNIGYA